MYYSGTFGNQDKSLEQRHGGRYQTEAAPMHRWLCHLAFSSKPNRPPEARRHTSCHIAWLNCKKHYHKEAWIFSMSQQLY